MYSDVQKLLQKHLPQKLPLQRRKLLPPKKLRLLAGDLFKGAPSRGLSWKRLLAKDSPLFSKILVALHWYLPGAIYDLLDLTNNSISKAVI